MESLTHPDFFSLAHPDHKDLNTPPRKNCFGFSIRGHGGDMGLGGMGQRDLGLTGQETDFESLAHPDQK